ncbi:ARM repeat superfamily protein [Wolffia australiana]
MAEKSSTRASFWCGLLLLLLSSSACFYRVVVARSDGENGTSDAKILLAATGEAGTLGSVPVASRDVTGEGIVVDSDAIVDEDVDGAFPSLEGMLQWAIGNSDPVKLKEKANDVQRMSAEELDARRLEIKELVDKLKMPSDADLMKISIGDLNNSSTSVEDRQRALNELLELVEPIDNANDLVKLGGLVTVIGELNHSAPQLRTTSAWILGKASQNNPHVQHQALSLGALKALMKMVHSCSVEESLKAMYAISALIRNNAYGQELFLAEAGCEMLQELLRNSSVDLRLQKKTVQMIADLAEFQLEENAPFWDLPLFRSPIFFKSLVNLLSFSDIDIQEKALMAIGSLLRLPNSEMLAVGDPCGLERALDAMTAQIISAKEESYTKDLEDLCRQVRAIFLKKQETKPSVSTI